MTTPATLYAPSPKASLPHRALDRIFFGVMSLVILAIVFFGFARTYFLAGTVHAPLPNLLIHIHGAVFTLWIVLFLVQTALIATHNVRIHRRLGIGGFTLACCMIVLGVLAAVDAMRRGSGPLGLDAKSFFIIPMSDMLLFAIFIAASFRARRRPEAHKRLILIATIALTDAAVGRWPIALFQHHPPTQDIVPLLLLLMIAAFDLTTLRRLSRSTLWAGALLMAVHLTRVPIGMSHAWHTFADFMLRTV